MKFVPYFRVFTGSPSNLGIRMHMVVVLLILLAGVAFYGIVLCVLVGLCRDATRGDAALGLYGPGHRPAHERHRISA
jgi:hypothetical protein